MTDIALGESPRWHEGRLWFCDWVAGEVIEVGEQGEREVVARMEGLPFCIDWLPDGRLLVVAGPAAKVLRREGSGELAVHADLGGITDKPWNEVVVDGGGRAYVNGIGFDLAAGEQDDASGVIALVEADGSARRVADGLRFPNGMALTPDGSTLIVAESYTGALTAFDVAGDGSLENRRVWASVEGAAPDGICIDAEGAVWYADVPNRCCVRVREGGEILETVELDRGGFSCALGGADGRTLFVTAAEWRGFEAFFGPERTGVLYATRVAVPAPAR